MMNSCFVQAKVRDILAVPLRVDSHVRWLIKAGDIHIWDRDSGILVQHFRARDLGGSDITCIAWNPVAEPYMFATGSHDGAVRVWTTMPPPRQGTLPSAGEAPNDVSSLQEV